MKKTSSCCGTATANNGKPACGCSDNSQSFCHEALPDKKLLIEFMYIDLSTCDRCIGTDTTLEEAVVDVHGLLTGVGYRVELRKTLVETERQAQELRFTTSPTIRINGADIQLNYKENDCGCCGEIAGVDTDCRVWLWNGQEYTTPPKAMLIDAIMHRVYGGSSAAPAVTEPGMQPVPENLKKFFNAKQTKN